MAGCCSCHSHSSTTGLQVLLQAVIEQFEIFNGLEEATLTPIPMGSVSAATLGADTNYHIALTDDNPKRFILIVNRTDGDVYASLNGTDNHFHITSGSSQRLDLASNRVSWNENVYVKQDTANPPASGDVEVSAYY